MTFVVTFAVFELGMSLVRAGTLLAVIQVSGVIGRIAWGIVADRIQHNGAVLVVIGLISAASALGFALITPQTPGFVSYGLAVAFGVSAVGWNGGGGVRLGNRAGVATGADRRGIGARHLRRLCRRAVCATGLRADPRPDRFLQFYLRIPRHTLPDRHIGGPRHARVRKRPGHENGCLTGPATPGLG